MNPTVEFLNELNEAIESDDISTARKQLHLLTKELSLETEVDFIVED